MGAIGRRGCGTTTTSRTRRREKRGVKPDPDLVLTEDPREMPLARAVRYILSIPTNVHLIVSSSLGYFYFSGLSTFALLFVKGHYHVNQATAEVVLARWSAGR